MSEDMVNIILGGARYCYKGEAPAYFQQLVVTDVFNRLLEHAQPEVFFEFVERECEHLLKPIFLKKYDPYYERIFREMDSDVHERYLSGSNLPCIFKFCHYVPIRLGPEGLQTLQPQEKLRFTLSPIQTNISMRVSLVVLNNMTQPQECIIECT